ncbi:unnamed protein product [Rhizophagus irregularis]|nr:unnamed protein product [Rhizophagus irregularis]
MTSNFLVSYFRSAFSNVWAEKKDGKFIFEKPNISPQLFDIILRFLYSGSIELRTLQCQDILNKAEFLQRNPIEILEISYQYEPFTDLSNFCLEKICEEPSILFNSTKFINLKAPLLELLLKRDDLFYNIEPSDFIHKIFCYKNILPQDLVADLVEFNFVPNIKPKENMIPPRKSNLNHLKLNSTIIETKIYSSFCIMD